MNTHLKENIINIIMEYKGEPATENATDSAPALAEIKGKSN